MLGHGKVVQALLLCFLVVVGIYAIIQSGATNLAKDYYCKITDVPAESVENNTDEFTRILNSAFPGLQKCEQNIDVDHTEINNKSIVLAKRLRELKYYINGTIRKLKEQSAKNTSKEILAGENSISQLHDLIYSDVINIDEENNLTVYRKNELTKVIKTVLERIQKIQFPADCKTAKKIRCFIPSDCGFGCQFHTFAGCLIDGYSTKRVVILQSWNYRAKWDEIFQPLTSCTLKDISDPSSNFSKGMDNLEVLNDSVIFADIRINLPSSPFAFPAEFAPTLLKMHPDPPVFWIGIFMQYLMRYQPSVQDHIDTVVKALNFNKDQPIAGIHVRRTNKVNREAELFQIEEYMEHVEAWYKMQSAKHGKILKKRLLLTTEDASVINETLLRYPDYELLYDNEGITRADSNRNSGKGVIDIVTGIYMLTRCDFVVCTHSSNVCRFVYELMQVTQLGEITTNVLSLDNIHYWYGQMPRQHIAKLAHKPEPGVNAENGVNEIELNVGDIIDIDTPIIGINRRNYFDGLSYGRNRRTQIHGKYPTYKVEENYRIVDF